MKKDILRPGKITFVILIDDAGTNPVRKFLDGLDRRRKGDEDKIYNVINWMIYHGRPCPNEQKFKKLTTDGIWEIKGGQVRLLGFFALREFIITNGFIKKTNRTDPKAIKKAQKIMEAYHTQFGREK